MIEHADNDRIELPPSALEALEILEEAGYEAWCVGGFIRDALIGQVGSDIDIATSAPWTAVRDSFSVRGYKVFETGVAHGTVTVSSKGGLFEVTTYRREGPYSDKRRPDSVTFIQDIEGDLARRDFTMNAIAYHPHRGFCDPLNGMGDIRRRIIRSVGNPCKRFDEDALRILRACRFASQLGFRIEEQTAQAMMSSRESLSLIAAERICDELGKLFCGAHVHDTLLACFAVVSQVVPEAVPMHGFDQRTPYHIYDVLEHTAWCMQGCPQTPLVRWAAFFHDIGKPEAFFIDDAGVGHFYGHAEISVRLASSAMQRLRVPRAFMHDVNLLIRHHDDIIPATPKAVKRAMRKLDGRVDLFRALCDLKRGDALAQAPRCSDRVALADELDAVLDSIIAEKGVFTRKDLAIDGNDIIGIGVEPGPEIGTLLDLLLDAVVDDKVVNDRDELIAFAKRLYRVSRGDDGK